MAIKDIKGKIITDPIYIPTAMGEVDLQSISPEIPDFPDFPEIPEVDLSNLVDKITVGDLEVLKTTEKNNIVGSINELFQNVDNGKNLVRSAIIGKGGTVPTDPTFTDLKNQIDLTFMFKKDTKLIPSNIKKDIAIGGVVGTVKEYSLKEKTGSVEYTGTTTFTSDVISIPEGVIVGIHITTPDGGKHTLIKSSSYSSSYRTFGGSSVSAYREVSVSGLTNTEFRIVIKTGGGATFSADTLNYRIFYVE